MSWIIDLKYEQCVVKTDSKILVQACKKAPGESFFGTRVVKTDSKILVQACKRAPGESFILVQACKRAPSESFF